MVGVKPTHLWHHLCRKHFWWLIHERIYARCPVKKKFKKYYQIPDPCKEVVCPPHDHFNKFDMLKIIGIVLAGTGGLCYAFGHFDLDKCKDCYASYDCTDVTPTEGKEVRKFKKIPCDQREPEPVPPCVCDEPEAPRKKFKKKEKKPTCI